MGSDKYNTSFGHYFAIGRGIARDLKQAHLPDGHETKGMQQGGVGMELV
jgi:hypothetical protein